MELAERDCHRVQSCQLLAHEAQMQTHPRQGQLRKTLQAAELQFQEDEKVVLMCEVSNPIQ
jgi:hypothetical protein